MSNTNTGGPAFPQHGFDTIAERFTSQGGMTLRDYFAAKAMQCYMDKEIWNTDTYKAAAKCSYAVADAMLKAREA
jgi:hypothetical protein